MSSKNVCLSVFVLATFLQTVFNLPVDAQDLKKETMMKKVA
jgi:hypothetical protein